MYQGQSLRVTLLEDGLAELCFDRQDSAINKFDSGTVAESPRRPRRSGPTAAYAVYC